MLPNQIYTSIHCFTPQINVRRQFCSRKLVPNEYEQQRNKDRQSTYREKYKLLYSDYEKWLKQTTTTNDRREDTKTSSRHFICLELIKFKIQLAEIEKNDELNTVSMLLKFR